MASLTTASTSTGETKDNVLNCKWGKIQLQLNFKPGITTVGDLRTIISKSTSIQASGIKLLNLKIKKRKLDDTCLVSDCKLPKILKIMGTAQSNMLSAAPSSNPTQQPRETYVYGALFCSQAKRERDESAEKSSQNSSKKPKYDTTSLSSGLRESIAKVLSKVSPEVSLATDAMNFMDEILHKFFDALQASNNGNNEMITLSVLQNSLRIGLGDELSTFFLSQAAKDDKKSSEPSESSTSSSQVLGLTGPLFSLSLAGSIFSQPITKDALSLLAASVEFLASEILELSGNTASECERKTVLPCDIQSALRNDEELNVLCTNLNVSMTDYYPVFQLISGVDGQVTQLSLEHLIRTRDNHGSAFGVLSGMDCSSSDLNVIIPNVTTTAIKVVYKWHCGTNCTSCIVECLKTAADPTLYTEVFMAADFLGCGELCDVLLQSFELATDPIDTIRSCFQMIPNFPQILFFRLGLPDEATAGEFLRTLTTNPQELTYSELQLCDGMYLKEGALSYLSEPLQNVPMVGLSPEIEKSLSVSAFNGYRHLQTKEKQKSKTWNISTTLELKEWTKKERLRRQEMFDAGKNGAVERTTNKLVDQQFWLAVAEDDLPAAKNLYKQGACANLWFEFEETGNEGIAVPFDTYKMISNWEGTPFDDWKNHLYRTDSSILPHLMKYGLTTLMKASQNNSIAMMSWLIDVGCDVNESQPNFKDANGFFPFGGATALVCASTPDAVKLLLARGADPNAWYTPPQESAGLDARPVLATHLELRRGSDRNLIARALVHHGANVNEVSYPCFDRGSDDGWRHKLNNSPVSYWPSVVASGDTVWAKELIVSSILCCFFFY